MDPDWLLTCNEAEMSNLKTFLQDLVVSEFGEKERMGDESG